MTAAVLMLAAMAAVEGVERVHEEIVYEHPDRTPIILRGESRSVDAKATLYAVGCDIYFEDGTLEWHFIRDFPNGTHDWTETSGLHVPKKPVKRLVVYAGLRDGTGSARFRNCRVERRYPAPEERFGVQRRTLLPFENADELHFESYDPQRGWRRNTEKVPAEIEVEVPLAADEVRVWTADAFRRVTPLTFPGGTTSVSSAMVNAPSGQRGRDPSRGRQPDAAEGQARPSLESAHRISLQLARGETENAQILVSAGRAAGTDGLRLELAPPAAASGAVFRGELAWKRQGYLKRAQIFRQLPDSPPSHESWVADPLLPAAPFAVPAGGTAGLWLEAKSAADCDPGVYRAEAKVLKGETVLATVPIELEVSAATLPKRFSLVTLVSNFDGYLRRLYGAGWERMRRPVADVMLDHRLNPVDENRFLPPDPEDVLYAHSRGANAACLLNLVPVPRDTNAIWVCYAPREELEGEDFYRSVRERLDPVWRALKDTPAKDDLLLYGFDERRRDFYPVMDRLWRRLQRDYPGLPLKTSAKMYRDLAAGEKGELLYTSDWFDPRIDVWKPSVTAELKARGKKVGFYVSEDPLPPWPGIGSYEFHRAAGRALFWIAYREDADLFSYWAANYWNYMKAPLDERSVYFPGWDTWNPSRMHGDGVLIYPGRNSILPSIRLAQLRDGEEDYELLKLYEARHGREAALGESARIVRGLADFSYRADDYRAVRRELLGNVIISGTGRFSR